MIPKPSYGNFLSSIGNGIRLIVPDDEIRETHVVDDSYDPRHPNHVYTCWTNGSFTARFRAADDPWRAEIVWFSNGREVKRSFERIDESTADDVALRVVRSLREGF